MAAVKKTVKKKEHEKLTDSNILRVIEMLEKEKPITKKEACEILNISYNTTRLNTILENFKSEKETSSKRKAEKKGKPPQPGELRLIAEQFLSGEAMNEIANRLYRSVAFVKTQIQRIGIPERATGDDKYQVCILPEECISEDFSIGEIAWSAVYHAPCEIRGILDKDKYGRLYGTNCYRVYVIEKVVSESSYFPMINTGGFNAFSASYDLGKLNHIKDLGVDLNTL